MIRLKSTCCWRCIPIASFYTSTSTTTQLIDNQEPPQYPLPPLLLPSPFMASAMTTIIKTNATTTAIATKPLQITPQQPETFFHFSFLRIFALSSAKALILLSRNWLKPQSSDGKEKNPYQFL